MTHPVLSGWLEKITAFHTSSVDLGLSRIQPIIKENNLNQFDCPVITVAGTNGKGSCLKLLESMYGAAGYRVGAYYSPHLEQFNERYCINGTPIDDHSLISLFETVDHWRAGRSLSFFEFTTLAVLEYFKGQSLDVVLLEVGLGGRLDAVNAVDSDVSLVTSIGLDHQAWLGENREAIAAEKAAVYRSQKPAICGDPEPPASLLRYADQIGSILYIINKDFSYELNSDSWNWRSPSRSYRDLPCTSLKLQNAATSLMVLESLRSLLPVSEKSIKKGLKNARLSGRFEVVSSPVNAILDVAHNPDSAGWLGEQLAKQSIAGKTIVVWSMLEDKAMAETVMALKKWIVIDQWYVGRLKADRAASLNMLQAQLKICGVGSCDVADSVEEAMTRALAAYDQSAGDRIVVFGSFHTVQAARIVIDACLMEESSDAG